MSPPSDAPVLTALTGTSVLLRLATGRSRLLRASSRLGRAIVEPEWSGVSKTFDFVFPEPIVRDGHRYSDSDGEIRKLLQIVRISAGVGRGRLLITEH
jgi:hypothetical protein